MTWLLSCKSEQMKYNSLRPKFHQTGAIQIALNNNFYPLLVGYLIKIQMEDYLQDRRNINMRFQKLILKIKEKMKI